MEANPKLHSVWSIRLVKMIENNYSEHDSKRVEKGFGYLITSEIVKNIWMCMIGQEHSTEVDKYHVQAFHEENV